MPIDWIESQVEVTPPVDLGEPGSLVALRSWLIVSERLPLGRTQPMLTGLYGYPWRTRRLDARCTATNRLDPDFTLPPRIERHHMTVPEATCGCDIYANRDETSERVELYSPLGVPTVTGFVELSGRTIAGQAATGRQRRSWLPRALGAAPNRREVGRVGDDYLPLPGSALRGRGSRFTPLTPF